MADLNITRELEATRGRYVGRVPGVEGEAELTFLRLDGGRVLADHTLTPVPLRGRGIASALKLAKSPASTLGRADTRTCGSPSRCLGKLLGCCLAGRERPRTEAAGSP